MKKISSIALVLVVLFGFGIRVHASVASDLYVKTQGLLSQVQQSLATVSTQINSAVSEGVHATLTKASDLIAQIEQVRSTLPASALPALDAANKSLSTAAINLDNKERVATQVPLRYVFTTGAATGATGEYIKRIQTVLKENGYFSGAVTGSFGPITKAAVAAYQADHGLSAIGSVGPATAAKLTEDAKVLGVCAGVNGPYMKVISPNGREVYQSGQKIIVKWKSCNTSGVQYVQGSITDMVTGLEYPAIFTQHFNQASDQTANDGHEEVTLPTTSTTDFRYKLNLQLFMTTPGPGDSSDNLFAINHAVS